MGKKINNYERKALVTSLEELSLIINFSFAEADGVSCQLCCVHVGMLPLSNQRWLSPGASLSFQVLWSWIDTNSPTKFVHAHNKTLALQRAVFYIQMVSNSQRRHSVHICTVHFVSRIVL